MQAQIQVREKLTNIWNLDPAAPLKTNSACSEKNNWDPKKKHQLVLLLNQK
jgi:hypothetical protein